MATDVELGRLDDRVLASEIGRREDEQRRGSLLIEPQLAAEDDDLCALKQFAIELELKVRLGDPTRLVLDAALPALPPATH